MFSLEDRLEIAFDRNDDPSGAIKTLSETVETLKNMVVLENPQRAANLDRMANRKDFDKVCKALARLQLVASSIEVRMIANAEMD